MVKKRQPIRKKQSQTNRRTGQLGGAWNIVDDIQHLLAEVLKFTAPADVVTSAYFRAHAHLGLRERGLIAESVFAVLRRKLEFSQFSESGVGDHLRRLALLGLAASASPAVLTKWISQEESIWLDHLRKIDRNSLAQKIRANLPNWVLTELQERFAMSEIEQLAQVLQEAAPLDLRVNTLQCSREQLLARLADTEDITFTAQATPFSPDGIRLSGKPALSKMAWFIEGWAEVQDEGSQLLAHLLAPKRGEMVVDFCAGAGGKTLAIGALMRNTGRLYALDIAARRLAKLKPRLSRSGLSNVHPVLIDSEHDAKLKRMAGKADRVLVDAPCSGLGTLRRNPDLKWRQSPAAVAELGNKQLAILSAAAKMLKPGGRLVYATCSFMRAENQQIVDQFLATHPEFMRLHAGELLTAARIPLTMEQDLELWPHVHQTDGFYAAVLQRAVA